MRKYTVKKILAALLALGAISALTACNNSQTTAQSTAESSKSVSESSTESSQESSAESSIESSVESSKEVSESSVESSKESSKESSSESSVESSKAISESSVESSKENSKAESSTASSSTIEEKKYTLDDAIAYGKIIYPAHVYKASDSSCTIGLDIGTYIAILSTDDPETYDFIYEGYRYKIAKKRVELFPEDYVPDFSKPFWFTVSDIL